MRVRYYRQLKPQRVHTAEVSWQHSAEPARGEITVRLLAAGAQVVPSELTMDCSKPDAKAVFYVTPLARGWLRNEKLEVLAHHRKVQEIPMASKVVGQKLTWLLLILTFFVPWFITEFVKHSPMTDATRLADGRIVHRYVGKEVEAYIKDNVPSLPKSWKGGAVDTDLQNARTWVANRYQQTGASFRDRADRFLHRVHIGGAYLGIGLFAHAQTPPGNRQAHSGQRPDRAIRSGARSGSLDDNLGDDLGDVFASIHRFLEPTVELAPLDETQDVRGAVGEQGSIRLPVDQVGFIFQAGDPRQPSVDLFGFLQIAAQADGVLKMRRAIHDDACQVNRRGGRFFQAKDVEAVGRLFHVIQNVVELGCQRVNVFPVEGRDEGAIERLDDFLDLLVARLFLLLDVWPRWARLSKTVTMSRNLTAAW